MQKFKFFTLAILAMLSVNLAWGAEAEEGDILWKEMFTGGSSSTTFSETSSWSTGTGTTMLVAADKSKISYTTNNAMLSTVSSGGIDGSHVWLKKSTTGYFEVDNIPVYNASKLSVSLIKNNKTTITFSYKFDTESSWTSCGTTGSASNTSGTSSDITVPSTASSVSLKFTRNSNNDASRIDNLTLTVLEVAAAATPTITKTANLTDFTYEAGSGPSAAQSFTVGGSNLTANIVVTAPTNFEVSKSSGSGYASSVTLTQSSGTVSNTPIYVRMKSGLSQGTGKGGNITLSSTGATQQTIAVVGTVTAPSYTVTAQSNNTELGTVSGTTTITAFPTECVGYDNPAYTVAPEGKATVNQSDNIFTVSDVTDNVTVTINFVALTPDTYEDHLHNNTTIERCGSYPAPSLDDATKATTGDCDVDHYHFAGWVTSPIYTGTPGTPDDMVTAGTAMKSNGTPYIAVWAKEQ